MRDRPSIPILIEDPPSSEDQDDDPALPNIKSRISHSASRLEVSSTGSFQLASAPATPSSPMTSFLGDDDTINPFSQQNAALFTTSSPQPIMLTDPLCPQISSRTFSKHDRQALKQLSTSAPAMPMRMSPARSDSELMLAPSSSKSRQKKFHRHFKQVASDEKVLDYFSCALVGDILLQGHLYITENHYAFYSNVFGYVTKLLIPLNSVLKLTKEKTARIIPNAVGVYTDKGKHVFGSLLSRDSTYKLMLKVWKHKEAVQELSKEILIVNSEKTSKEDLFPTDPLRGDSSESMSGNDSAIEHSCSQTPVDTPTEDNCVGVDEKTPIHKDKSIAPFKHLNGSVPIKRVQMGIKETYVKVTKLYCHSSVLLFATILLILLFLSASVLIYRINNIQQELERRSSLSDSGFVYEEMLKLQNHLHSTSASEFQRFLNANVDQIAKVRQSLEALSMLLVTKHTDDIPTQESH